MDTRRRTGPDCDGAALVQLVAAGTLRGLEDCSTPRADSAAVFLGATAGMLVAIGGLISIAGADRTSLVGGGLALIVGAVLYVVSVGASGPAE